jgi:hypothetical protein
MRATHLSSCPPPLPHTPGRVRVCIRAQPPVRPAHRVAGLGHVVAFAAVALQPGDEVLDLCLFLLPPLEKRRRLVLYVEERDKERTRAGVSESTLERQRTCTSWEGENESVFACVDLVYVRLYARIDGYACVCASATESTAHAQ